MTGGEAVATQRIINEEGNDQAAATMNESG